ncbi:hypothetical protein GCM10025787_41980 [Saccharopolyspora rosea]|uniref:LCP family protein n=1 Tax=Saccharopolyspora rosea TaxID=524884 RepID=UPI0031ED6BEC
MPQDPRHGSDGHRRSHPEADAGDTGSAAARRRRRALGDDGTGGTRVVDLLSKHGKSPGPATGSHRRRAAEPEQPVQNSRPPQPPQAQPPAPQPPAGPPQAARPQAPRPGAARPEPPQRPEPAQRPEPPQRPEPAQRSEPSPRPEPSQRSEAAPRPDPRGWTAPDGAAHPPTGRSRATGPQQRPGPDAPPENRPADGGRPGTPPGGWAPPAAARPARTDAATPPRPGRPAPQAPPSRGGAAPEASGGDQTRISQALSGGQRASQQGAPKPTAPGRPAAAAAAAAAGRAAALSNEDATAQYPAVRADADETTVLPPATAEAPQPEQTQLAKPVRPPRPQAAPGGDQTMLAKPVGPAPGAQPEATQLARPVGRPAVPPAPAEETALVESPPDDFDEDEDLFDDVDDEQDDDESSGEERHADIQQIDATLARFSAVHDEIAREEAARRKKYAWLVGKRKEPELGTDMPFDFHEGRDGKSRMEWKKQQRKRRTNLIVMAIAMAASLTVFVTIGIAWSAKSWVDGRFHQVQALDPGSASIKDAAKQTGDQNFLLIGSDTRAGAKPSDGVGDAQDEPGARSDTTMVAHIPADRSRIDVVSFPRDLKVDMPACERWDSASGRYTGQQLPPRKDVRLNEAFAVGGPKCTTKVIQQISGLSITSFLGVDFQGFKSMVDAMQGVEVCSDKPIVDTNLGTVLPTAGRQTLTGDQALSYVRARHVVGDPTSDYGRMQRQQMFLSSVLRKAMSSQVLLDPKKLGGFVNAVTANTFGENVSTDKLMELGQSLQGLDPAKVTFATVPTTGYADSEGMEVLRDSDARALFQAIIDGAPVAPKTADAGPQQAAGSGALASGGASGPRAQTGPGAPAPNPAPPVPGNLSTVNAGTDLCG